MAISNKERANTFLPQIGLSLLDSGEDHIANSGGRKPVKARVHRLDGNHIQVLCTAVVSTVHHCSDRQSLRNLELNTD